MDTNPEDETSYTTHSQEAFLKCVDNEYCTKHWWMSVIKPDNIQHSIFFPSPKASGFGQSSFDPYELSSNTDGYVMPKCVAAMTPRRSDGTAHWLTDARLYLNSPPKSPKNWGQLNPNVNDYHSNHMEISGTFWLPNVTHWWRQAEETHSKYTDLSNVARIIFSIIPHGVGVKAGFHLQWDIIGWRQSKTSGEMLREKVVVRQFAWANNWILARNCAALDTAETENTLELKKEMEERKLHRMAKVHNILEMWQRSQNLRATQQESWSQNKQMTAVGYISDTEEIINTSWSNYQHDGAARFKLSERSPVPPALSAMNLPWGRTQVFNVHHIRRIDRHPFESDEDSAPERISHTDNWLHWNCYLDNPNQSKYDCEADNESDIELSCGIKVSKCPGDRVVSAPPNVAGLIWPTWKLMKQAEKQLVTVSATETRRNKGNKKK